MTTRRTGDLVRICSRQKTLRVPRRKIADLVAFVARSEKVALGDVDVAVVGAAEMARLNARYLSHAGATDVLSFDLSGPTDGAALSAQVIVCADIAAAEARERNCSPRSELLLYVAHGLLHLMGYDDTTPPAAAKMRARQDELLEAFGRKKN